MPERPHPCPYAPEGTVYSGCPRVLHGIEGEPCHGCPEATVRVAARPRPSTRAPLDRLLAAHPDAEVAWVENQRKEIVAARGQNPPPFDSRRITNVGPWTCVDLFEHGKILRFAIWNHTGDVYALDADGAVGDDPVLRAPAQPPA